MITNHTCPILCFFSQLSKPSTYRQESKECVNKRTSQYDKHTVRCQLKHSSTRAHAKTCLDFWTREKGGRRRRRRVNILSTSPTFIVIVLYLRTTMMLIISIEKGLAFSLSLSL